jgi:triacylglycerol esterase/lipase EstA (alpha/beta hydrolase family)
MKHVKSWVAAFCVILIATTAALAPPAGAAAGVPVGAAARVSAGGGLYGGTLNPAPRAIRIASIFEARSFPRAVVASVFGPKRSPLGANNWSCRPSAAHPNPVILIHGFLENAFGNWNGLAPILADAGYCVFALNYGNSTGIPFINGTGDVMASVQQIAAYVAQVRQATGAAHVSLIGHSMGGPLARYYADLVAPKGEVVDVIGLGPGNHPSSYDGIATLIGAFGLAGVAIGTLNVLGLPAIQQMAADTQFFNALNGHGETVAGINYLSIATVGDEFSTPYPTAFLSAVPGAHVANVLLQSVCPGLDASDHLSMPYDKNVAQLVLNALDPQDQHAIRCYRQAPIFGTTGP